MNGVVEASFTLNLTVMKILGIYPIKKCLQWHKLYGFALYMFAMVPSSLLGFIQLIFNKDTHERNYDDLIQMVLIFISPKLFTVLLKGSNIKKCILHMDCVFFENEVANHVDIIEKCVKICRRNSNVFFGGCVVSILSWCAKQFFSKTNGEFPVNIWLPSSLKTLQPVYYCCYCSIIAGVFYVGFACATVDPLIAGLICQASAQIQILKRNLQSLDENYYAARPDFIYKCIKNCIKHYDAIAKFVIEYESTWSSAVFCQFMESVIVICICCLQISKLETLDFNFFILSNYLCFLLLQIFFYCYYGTLLIEENNSLINCIYMCNWYTYSEESKKALLILMERSKKPMAVTAGKILDLSLDTFTSVLRRSYSLLAVLKNY